MTNGIRSIQRRCNISQGLRDYRDVHSSYRFSPSWHKWGLKDSWKKRPDHISHQFSRIELLYQHEEESSGFEDSRIIPLQKCLLGHLAGTYQPEAVGIEECQLENANMDQRRTSRTCSCWSYNFIAEYPRPWTYKRELRSAQWSSDSSSTYASDLCPIWLARREDLRGKPNSERGEIYLDELRDRWQHSRRPTSSWGLMRSEIH